MANALGALWLAVHVSPGETTRRARTPGKGTGLGSGTWARARVKGLGSGLKLRHCVCPGLIGQARRVAATVILAFCAQVVPLRAQAVPPWLISRSLASSPSHLPHCTHLPNFQWCGPPSGSVAREHTPEYDSMADIGCWRPAGVDASPSRRFEIVGELSGSRHFGHSSLLYLSHHLWLHVGQTFWTSAMIAVGSGVVLSVASVREPTNRDTERLRHVSNRFPLPLRSDKRSDECRDERDMERASTIQTLHGRGGESCFLIRAPPSNAASWCPSFLARLTLALT